MTDVTARDIVVVAVLGVVLGGGLGGALALVVQHFVTEHAIRSAPAPAPSRRPLLRELRGMRRLLLNEELAPVEGPPPLPELPGEVPDGR